MPRILLVLTIATSLFAQTQPATTTQRSHSADQIRAVLRMARDSALEQERAEDNMLGGFLPEHFQTIMRGFRTIGDSEDAVALQKGVRSIHKVDVLYARPNATIADYHRLQKTAQQLGEFDCDEGLRRIISQELEAGFFDDAERIAASISDARIRSEAYTEIAVSLWAKQKKESANRLFEAAGDAATKIESIYDDKDRDKRRLEQLVSIAGRRYGAGDKPGGLAMFARAHATAAEAKGYVQDQICYALASAQAELGLLIESRKSSSCIEAQIDRENVARRIEYQEVIQAEPARALDKSLAIGNGERRVEALVGIGMREAERGEKKEAVNALDHAMKAFSELSAADLYPRWAGHQLRMIAQTYLDLGERSDGEMALQRLQELRQATPSWREQYDFIYDLAVGNASFAHFDEAHQFINDMGQYPDEQTCNVVAYVQAQLGESREAASWALQLKDPSARTAALVGIVEAMLDANEEASKAASP